MKKLVPVVVALAVAFGFAVSANAQEKVQIKAKVQQNAAGTVTKEKTAIKTGTVKIEAKSKSVTKGDITKTKTKIVAEPKHGDVKKEYYKITKIEDNDPKDFSDNTITVISSKDEILKMPVSKDLKINNLKKHSDKTVTIYSTYDINAKDWIVTKLAD